MKIFVTGASGFVGGNLIPRLLESGHSVSAWNRRPDADLRLGGERRVSVFWGDLGGPDSEVLPKLKEAMRDCAAVVHLAAKTSQGAGDEARSAAVNVEGMRRLIVGAKACGARRFVYVSTQSAKISRPGGYGASKRSAEDLLARSGLDYVILRPAIIYGPGQAGIFRKFVGLVEKFPLLPIPWTDVTFQPVHIGDVVRSILAAVGDRPAPSRVYDVAGPDPVTFPQLIRLVAESLGLKRFLLPVPMPLAMAGAAVLSRITKNPPVTMDNLIGLTEVTAIDLAPLREEFEVRPLSLKEGLKQTFEVN